MDTVILILISAPCDNCAMQNGIGFNPHPDDCDKYTQCYFGGEGQIRAVYRQCPFGQYWDQRVLTCRPSQEVDCEKGKCRYLPSSLPLHLPPPTPPSPTPPYPYTSLPLHLPTPTPPPTPPFPESYPGHVQAVSVRAVLGPARADMQALSGSWLWER